jgi:hypothetical protein
LSIASYLFACWGTTADSSEFRKVLLAKQRRSSVAAYSTVIATSASLATNSSSAVKIQSFVVSVDTESCAS